MTGRWRKRGPGSQGPKILPWRTCWETTPNPWPRTLHLTPTLRLETERKLGGESHGATSLPTSSAAEVTTSRVPYMWFLTDQPLVDKEYSFFPEGLCFTLGRSSTVSSVVFNKPTVGTS